MNTSYSVVGAVLLLACATVSACSDPTTAPLPGVPSVDLSTPMSSLVITQGDSGSVDVTVIRNGGFSGPVTLTLSGAPAGVAGAVATNPVAGSSASLNISVRDAAVPGAYPLTLTAAGDGITPQRLPLELQVAQRMPLSVAVRYCTGIEPYWVAFQDGDGAWTQVQPSAAGGTVTFHLAFSTNRGAIATLNRYGLGASLTALYAQYGTPAELAAAGDTNPRHCGPAVAKTFLGTVAGLDTNESAFINAGSGLRAHVAPGAEFVINSIPTGPQDILATRSTPVNGSESITGMILRRDLDLSDSATLPVFDFAASEVFAPVVANVLLTGLGPEGASGSTGLLTSHDQVSITVVTNQGTEVTRQYVALPESQLLPGDLQVLFATSNPTTTGEGRTATLYFRAPIDRTLALGAPAHTPGVHHGRDRASAAPPGAFRRPKRL